MEFFALFSVFGAFVGYSAAQKKGWNPTTGILAGIFLGALAPLMYFMSGITRSAPQTRKCPHCAEWVQVEAKVCKHCRRDLPAIPGTTKVTRSGIQVNVPRENKKAARSFGRP